MCLNNQCEPTDVVEKKPLLDRRAFRRCLSGASDAIKGHQIDQIWSKMGVYSKAAEDNPSFNPIRFNSMETTTKLVINLHSISNI